MREIKFRAWDTKNKKWAFEGFHLLGEVMLFDLLGQYRLEEHCDLLVEQFTGLKDRNGTEIYEGDIVQIKTATCPDGKNYQVFWNKAIAGCDFIGGGAFINQGVAGISEVIGNVHGNPELLK